jgi:hypothetical protein
MAATDFEAVKVNFTSVSGGLYFELQEEGYRLLEIGLPVGTEIEFAGVKKKVEANESSLAMFSAVELNEWAQFPLVATSDPTVRFSPKLPVVIQFAQGRVEFESPDVCIGPGISQLLGMSAVVFPNDRPVHNKAERTLFFAFSNMPTIGPGKVVKDIDWVVNTGGPNEDAIGFEPKIGTCEYVIEEKGIHFDVRLLREVEAVTIRDRRSLKVIDSKTFTAPNECPEMASAQISQYQTVTPKDREVTSTLYVREASIPWLKTRRTK